MMFAVDYLLKLHIKDNKNQSIYANICSWRSTDSKDESAFCDLMSFTS